MRVVTSCAGNIGPSGGVRHGCIGGEFSIRAGKEIIQRGRLGHAAVGKNGSGGVAGDAVLGILAVDHFVGSLTAATAPQFSGHISLGDAMFTRCPGIVDLMVGAADEQVAMALAANLAAVIQDDKLGGLGIEYSELELCRPVIITDLMASSAIDLRPVGGVGNGGTRGELAIGCGEKVVQRLGFRRDPGDGNSFRSVTGDAVFGIRTVNYLIRRLPAACIDELFRHISLRVGMCSILPG